MKHIYKLSLLMAFAISSLSVVAQKDTTLTRQVMLEREYTPSLQEAARINTNPAIYKHTIKPSEVNLIHEAPVLIFPHNKLGQTSPGDIGTQIPHDTKIGYLQMAAGTRANIDGAVGITPINTDTDRFDIFATYYSMKGNVDYADKDFLWEKKKAKYNNLNAKVRYAHKFEPATLSIDAGYGNVGYNYYGNSFLPKDTDTDGFHYKTKQNTDLFGIGVGLESNALDENQFNYDGTIRYDYFKNEYGAFTTNDAMKGGIINVHAGFWGKLSDGNMVGVKVGMLNQSINSSAQYMKDTLKNYTNIGATPYFKIEGAHWSTQIGFTANAIFDQKNKFFVAPNIKATININDVNTFYANVTGKVNDNTFLEILQENRYASPLGRVKYSKTPFDIQLGFKSGVVPGLQFDVFGGYKNTKDAHFYIASAYAVMPTSIAEPLKWGNVSVPVYGDLSTGHLGISLKTHLIPLTTLSTQVIAYFYNVKNLDTTTYPTMDKKAWGKPSLTADFAVDVKPINCLTISANYILSAGRKAYTPTQTVSMKAINEANAKIEVSITDWLSVNARANNILNQKYELVHGYTLQGFNALAGVNFKF